VPAQCRPSDELGRAVRVRSQHRGNYLPVGVCGGERAVRSVRAGAVGCASVHGQQRLRAPRSLVWRQRVSGRCAPAHRMYWTPLRDGDPNLPTNPQMRRSGRRRRWGGRTRSTCSRRRRTTASGPSPSPSTCGSAASKSSTCTTSGGRTLKRPCSTSCCGYSTRYVRRPSVDAVDPILTIT
jgi:hypothetical protein